MQKQQYKFKRNTLAIAISVAMLGGVSGCNENDPISPDALGEYSILANGGTGGSLDGGTGGDGGDITVYNDGAPGGVVVSKRSMANTNFTRPSITIHDADLGDNPLAVTADTTIDFISTVADGNGTVATEPYVDTDGVLRIAAGATAVYATDVIAAAGTNYLSNTNYSQDYSIYQSSGSATADAAYTGVSVAAGATLTLGDNNGCSARLVVENDIDNAGTITKVPNDCSLYLYTNNYIASGSIVNAGVDDLEPNAGNVRIYAVNIENSGNINTSGFDNPAGDGGDGDDVRLEADGYLINSGMIDTSGGDGMGYGGDADNVQMYGAYAENTANIDSSGGNNTTNGDTYGDGGDGDYVYVGSDYVTYNSGDVDSSGGDGSNGGSGGSTNYIYNDSLGEVKNSGNVNANGGKGYTSSGGSAGSMELYAYGGDALNSGDLSAVGGDTVNVGSSAGSGGDLTFYAYSGNNNTPAGDVEVSGNINISGGNSAAPASSGSGGDAGDLYINFDGGEIGYEDQRAALLGYVSIDANGGDGSAGADANNNIDFYTDMNLIPETFEFVSGPVMNDVAINARGGNSTTDATIDTAEGGDGGDIEIYTTTSDGVSHLEDISATNKANIDVSGGTGAGGNGGEYGGDGGDVEIDGYHSASNSGDVTANGADGGEYGGGGGSLDIYAVAGEARNGGTFTANGGAGARSGGYGGWIDVEGATGVNAGAIAINGGNATNPGDIYTDTDGGDGGDVTVLGAGLDGKATNTGAISNAPGTGTEDGDEGCIQIGALSFEGDCSNSK